LARPCLSKLDSWGKYEHCVIEVCKAALILLCAEEGLPSEEVDINRRLYFLIHRARRALRAKNVRLPSPPHFDANNSPDADDEKRAAREGKRPDFSFGLYDDQEVDPEKSAKFFVVECKRLGMPSGSWVFNRNYIHRGVGRFVSPESGYGKSVRSSAMIGYVQSMVLSKILAEVNKECERNQLPRINLSGGWKEGGVSQLEQLLTRLQISPMAFHLHHMWVDLRRKTMQN
jgi:hypothetical protein